MQVPDSELKSSARVASALSSDPVPVLFLLMHKQVPGLTSELQLSVLPSLCTDVLLVASKGAESRVTRTKRYKMPHT